MSISTVFKGLFVANCVFSSVFAQRKDTEQLILADCGIGDNKLHPDWSTSRQMNWYKSLDWPDSALAYPAAPDSAVEVPFKDGIYPWKPTGATAKLADGKEWTVFIAENSPEGVKAGAAVDYKNGGDSLNCWSYHGRPVSAAINKTVNADAICWSAFVCNKDNHAPPRAPDQNPQTSTSTSKASSTEPTDKPTTAPQSSGILDVNASVNPRFITWPSTWEKFIDNFVWNQDSGSCGGPSYVGTEYTITFDCSGVRIDEDSHMTLILIKALHDIGQQSQWFYQSAFLPGSNATNSEVVMPQAVKLVATDATSQKTLGSIAYKANFHRFTTGSCSTCETQKFNDGFFGPILDSLRGTFPEYNDYRVEAICDPWVVCY